MNWCTTSLNHSIITYYNIGNVTSTILFRKKASLSESCSSKVPHTHTKTKTKATTCHNQIHQWPFPRCGALIPHCETLPAPIGALPTPLPAALGPLFLCVPGQWAHGTSMNFYRLKRNGDYYSLSRGSHIRELLRIS